MPGTSRPCCRNLLFHLLLPPCTCCFLRMHFMVHRTSKFANLSNWCGFHQGLHDHRHFRTWPLFFDKVHQYCFEAKISAHHQLRIAVDYSALALAVYFPYYPSSLISGWGIQFSLSHHLLPWEEDQHNHYLRPFPLPTLWDFKMSLGFLYFY